LSYCSSLVQLNDFGKDEIDLLKDLQAETLRFACESAKLGVKSPSQYLVMYRLYHCWIPIADTTSSTKLFVTCTNSVPAAPVKFPAIPSRKDSRSWKSPFPVTDPEPGAVVAPGVRAVDIWDPTPPKNEDTCDTPGRLIDGSVGVGN